MMAMMIITIIYNDGGGGGGGGDRCDCDGNGRGGDGDLGMVMSIMMTGFSWKFEVGSKWFVIAVTQHSEPPTQDQRDDFCCN